MTDPVVTSLPPEEHKKKPNGLQICNYVVPWWVVIVVVCVLIYLALDNEIVDGLQKITGPKEVKLSGSTLNVTPPKFANLDTPRDLRNFLRY